MAVRSDCPRFALVALANRAKRELNPECHYSHAFPMGAEAPEALDHRPDRVVGEDEGPESSPRTLTFQAPHGIRKSPFHPWIRMIAGLQLNADFLDNSLHRTLEVLLNSGRKGPHESDRHCLAPIAILTDLATRDVLNRVSARAPTPRDGGQSHSQRPSEQEQSTPRGLAHRATTGLPDARVWLWREASLLRSSTKVRVMPKHVRVSHSLRFKSHSLARRPYAYC